MFSIVVPTYNKQDFIGRTIESVLGQNFDDFELIVVNDGSADLTAERVLAFDDPRIILVNQKNRGEGGARNTGMHRASRPWIALLDADDYWFSDHLSELARVIDAFPEAGMVATSFIAGEEWQATSPPRRSDLIERIDYFQAAARDIGVVWSSTAAIRRDVAAKVGPFGGFRRGADQEYWVRTALQTPVARSTRVTAYYFRHAGGVMASDHNRVEIAPDRIEDMWPSVAVTQRARQSPAYRSIVDGLVAYERHATYLSMIGYISRREFDVARRLAKNLPGHRIDKAAVIRLVLKLPAIVLSALLSVRLLANGIIRR